MPVEFGAVLEHEPHRLASDLVLEIQEEGQLAEPRLFSTRRLQQRRGDSWHHQSASDIGETDRTVEEHSIPGDAVFFTDE